LPATDTEEHRSLGRNAPCWCGSGRKYKVCHLNRPAELPLPVRADWLYRKAQRFVYDGGYVPLLTELALIRAEQTPTREAATEALAEPLTADLVLFEARGLEDFLAYRGDLLPEDEMVLATSWLDTSRSVYEVEQVHRDRGVDVRDIRTGDTMFVSERSATGQLRPTMRICARILPVGGDALQFFGGLEPVADLDPLIELLDEIDEEVDERIHDEIGDELADWAAGMDPDDVQQVITDVSGRLANRELDPEKSDLDHYLEDADEDDLDEDGDPDVDLDEDEGWAALALMRELSRRLAPPTIATAEEIP
jgi:hypothetical protein